MRQLIKNILNESKLALELLDTIKNEDIFAAVDLVGGVDNLKKIFKEFPDITELLDSLKSTLNLIYHSKKEYIEFPVRFEIVGIKNNTWNTNSWPVLNLIYDDSKLSERDKKLFDQFVYDTIGDLNIGNIDIKPEVRDMYKDGYYVAIDFVNGKKWESLDHDIKYDDNDIKNLHFEYYTKSYMNESKILQENEEDPTQKILNFLLRRYEVEEKDIGWEDNPIKLKMIKFEIDGERYSISTFENKRQQIAKILDMLTIYNVIDNIDSNEGKLDPYTQKVIRAVKTFINQVM
jgi:hypothetical protein